MVHRVLQEQTGLAVRTEHRVLTVRQVQMEHQALTEHQVQVAHLAVQELVEQEVHRVQMVLAVRMGLQG